MVFTQVADPVGQRLIDSLARPGGNATGLTNFEFTFGAKWIELLAELDPTISHVTLITNPANENTAQFVKVITAAGDTKNVAVRVASVRDATDIQDAIENCSKKPGGGLVSFPDGLPPLNILSTYSDARPADLPVEAPTELEFVINLKTAQGLGLTISPRLQIAANELIQ